MKCDAKLSCVFSEVGLIMDADRRTALERKNMIAVMRIIQKISINDLQCSLFWPRKRLINIQLNGDISLLISTTTTFLIVLVKRWIDNNQRLVNDELEDDASTEARALDEYNDGVMRMKM